MYQLQKQWASSHERGTVIRIFAMKYHERVRLCLCEELLRQLLLIVVVESSLDMTTIILIFEATVNDQSLLVLTGVLAVQDIDHGVVIDTW
jgi:hypothetical protein